MLHYTDKVYIQRKQAQPPEIIRKLPTDNGQHPLGSTYRMQYPIDLDAVGYVEEEYYIAGTINQYNWPKGDPRPSILYEGVPYATRVLVRKPADPNKFSGFVCTELLNGSAQLDYGPIWSLCWERIIADGDGWIAFSSMKSSMELLKKYDPERYGDIGFPNPVPPEERTDFTVNPSYAAETIRLRGNVPMLLRDTTFDFGLSMDVWPQLSAWVRRCQPGDPFCGYEVKKVFIDSVFDGNGFIGGLHPYYSGPDDSPIFDGYIMFMMGSGGMYNRENPEFSRDDPRCRITVDVPVIKLKHAGDMRNTPPHRLWSVMWRCEDGDEPGHQMRWYEVPGVAIKYVHNADRPPYSCLADYEALDIQPPQVTESQYDCLMSRYMQMGAYENLKNWMLGTVPPRGDRLNMTGQYPSFDFIYDDNGNQTGGIRNPYVDVPLATYVDDGTIIPFSKEKRDSLYASKEDYVLRVAASAWKMVKDGWIPREGAMAIIEQARRIDWDKI